MTFRFSKHILLPALFLALHGCAMQSQWREASKETVREQDLGNLPYHPLVYHLDLCVLSYQLYSQSLVWPFDPYYEELNNWQWDRTKFIDKVQGWAQIQGPSQVRTGAGLKGYRGPGVLGGFANNPDHDPIIYRYDRLCPWSNTITNAAGKWTEYLTPELITDQIREVYVCYGVTGGAKGEVAIERLSHRHHGSVSGARDVLLVFEGGTGDKGEPGQPSSQSLMGFVLLRHAPTGDHYDVHITFRGSRSGSAGRAARQGFSSREAKGNPDWITDLGYRQLTPEEGGAIISTTGKVSRGFSHSMRATLPQVVRCLRKVATLKSGRRPDNIYVTGHSLGGALAQHFVSAVLLGDRYGPDASGAAMPSALRAWPWQDVKLITYGAPRAGDAEWARTLTESRLDSEVFSTAIDSYDRQALPLAHPSIVPRLRDHDRPAGFRVLFVKDPITTSRVTRGKHVGKSVYLDRPNPATLLWAWALEAHEPEKMREVMLENLADPRIPAIAWRYREMSELNPARDDGERGNAEELRKLKLAIDRYYREHDQWFDHAAFSRDFDLYMGLRESPYTPRNPFPN
jgi:hypothetical protein